MAEFADALAIPQQQAVKVATALGALAEPRITERITIVVVANRAPRGAKYQRAQDLIASGRAITILTESEFHDYGRRVRSGVWYSPT